MNNEKKLNMLVESYEELLKGNYEKNSSYFCDLIGKVSRYDKIMAAEMWRNVLNIYKYALKDEEYAGKLTFCVWYEISKEIGEKEATEILIANPDITYDYFANCIDCDEFVVIACLENNFHEEAIKIFDMIYNNKEKINDLGKKINNDEYILMIFNQLASNSTLLDEKGIEILELWAARVENKEYKAKVNICLLKLIDVYELNKEEEYDVLEEDDDNDEKNEYDEPNEEERREYIETLVYNLACTNLDNRKETNENLYLGQKVYLKSDFNNKYDSNAIEVFTNDNVSIGYLYHSDAMMWCKVIREGIKIEGEICEYKPLRERNSNAKSAIVKIKIYRVNT